mmetsp:Transcript_93376/g.145712  ORF Transcript_93376/g.145712 Transcript_93376/m.145712 type:complete len:782 (-) Transcript_93376:81-2426(-)
MQKSDDVALLKESPDRNRRDSAIVLADSRKTSPLFSFDGDGLPGGGPAALAVMVNILGADLEHTQEVLGRLVSDADEVLQGVLERIAILHARTMRLETACGLPPFEMPGEEDEEDRPASPKSARTDGEEDEEGCGRPEEAPATRRRKRKARRCRRGHDLIEEDNSEDAPPRLCSFCQCNKQTTHRCDSGCYFHACASCMSDISGEAEAETLASQEESCNLSGFMEQQPSGLAEDEEDELQWPPSGCQNPEKPRSLPSRSPSVASEEDARYCASFVGRPTETPSTMAPEEEEEVSDPSLMKPLQASGSSTPPALEGGEDPTSLSSQVLQSMVQEGLERSRKVKATAERGLKARVIDLESEVKELTRRLQAVVAGESPMPFSESGSSQCEASKQDHRATDGLQNELQRSSEELRVELSSMVAQSCGNLRKELGAQAQKLVQAVREECLASTGQAVVNLRSAADARDAILTKQVQAQQSEIAKLVASCKDSERESSKSSTGDFREVMNVLRRELVDDPEGRSVDLDASRQLEGLASSLCREDGLARSATGLSSRPDLPRGRIRPSSASRTKASTTERLARRDCTDGINPESLEGLAHGLMAVARVIGISKDKTARLGEGEWDWSKIGHRFEQAWELQAKELWHFGMPSRPSLIDFVKTKSNDDVANKVASTLPDRREGARLASRLAAADNLKGTHYSECAVQQLREYMSNTDRPPLHTKEAFTQPLRGNLNNFDETSRRSFDSTTSQSEAPTMRAGQSKAFAGLEALRQMRQRPTCDRVGSRIL